jgi:hypothetical protein
VDNRWAMLDHLGPEEIVSTGMKGKIRIKGELLPTGIGWKAES